MVHDPANEKQKPKGDGEGVPEGEQVTPKRRGQEHRGKEDDPDPPPDDYRNPLLDL